MRKKRSLAATLLLLNLSLFGVLFLLMIGFQSVFLTSLIVNGAKSDMEARVRNVASLLAAHADEAVSAQIEAAKEHGIRITVTDSMMTGFLGFDLSSTQYPVDVRADDGTLYHVMIDGLPEAIAAELHKTDNISLQGMMMPDGTNIVIPFSLLTNSQEAQGTMEAPTVSMHSVPVMGNDAQASPPQENLLPILHGGDTMVYQLVTSDAQGAAAASSQLAPVGVSFHGTIVSDVPVRDTQMLAQQSAMVGVTMRKLSLNWNLGDAGYETVPDDATAGSFETAIMRVPEREAYIVSSVSLLSAKQITHMLNQYVLVAFLLSIGLLALSTPYYYYKVVRPLQRMKQFTATLSNASFDSTLTLDAPLELTELSQSLSSLSTTMGKHVKGLQAETDAMRQEHVQYQEAITASQTLLASLTHELKTPLTIINGYMQGLKKGIYSAGDSQQSYALIQEEIDRANRLISEMITMSHMNHFRLLSTRKQFDLTRLFLHEMNRLEPVINGRRMTILYTCQENAIIDADPTLLEHVILNLLSNAINHAPESSQIEVKIDRTDREVSFCVKNTSRTFTPAELEALWEPFIRSQSASPSSVRGSGLGLFIVKRILELHGFPVQVLSQDETIAFSFTCPTPPEPEICVPVAQAPAQLTADAARLPEPTIGTPVS